MIYDFYAGFFLFVIAIALSIILDCKVEKTIPICIMFIIVTIYFTGLFDNMQIGLWAVLLIFISAIIFIFHQRDKINVNNIVSLGSVFFWIVLTLAVVQNLYKYPHTWDEVAQWALAPRYSFACNKFGAYFESNCIYPDYPPASAIFHYAWMHLGKAFDDNRLYISMTVLQVGFLLPILAKYNLKKHIFRNALICIAVYVSMFAFYSNAYTSLQVDCLLGICFAYIIYQVCWEDNYLVRYLGIVLGLFVLPIIKESGLFFSVIAIIIVGSQVWIGNKEIENKRTSGMLFLSLLLSCIISKLSWNWYLNKQEINKTWVNFLNISILPKVQDFQKIGFVNYFKALINYRTIETTSQTEFYIGILRVSCIVWLIVFFVSVVIVCKIKENKKNRVVYFVLMIGMIIYIISTSNLYLTSFGENEVAILSSLNRYLGTYFIAVYLILFYTVLNNIQKKWWIILIFLICPHIVISNTFINEIFNGNRNEEKQAFNEWVSYKEDISKLKDYIGENAVIHIFNGDIAGANYALTPIRVKSPLWQGDNFGWFRDYAKTLGYEYVYFDTISGTVETDEFSDEYADIFIDPDLIVDRGLYKVLYQNESPRLEFIKKIE